MYEAIARNRRWSFALVVGLVLLLGGSGFALAEAWEPGLGAFGGIVGLGLGLVLTLFAWLGGDRMVLASAGARRIQHADHPQLDNVVEEMAIAGGLPKPQVYLIDDPAPNAFAAGRSPGSAKVAITQGLLARLNRDELQGVIGHEMAHVQNRDILFMTMAASLLGAILILADIAGGMARSSSRSRLRSGKREGGGLFVLVAILIAIFVPLAARILYLAASRQREYLADATAALLTRYPVGLAGALEKIAQAPARLQVNGATAPLCIVNPLQSGTSVGWLAGLFSTHPPTERRIAILRGMGGGAGYADYERAYKATLGGGSVLPTSVRAAAGPAARAATAGAMALVAGVEAAAAAPAQPDVASYRAARATIRGAAGYRDVTCSCGLLIRIPPGFARPTVRCPRCGATVAVDGGSIAGAAVITGLSGDEGTRAERRSEGVTGCIAQGCGLLIGPLFLLAGLGVWALAGWQLSVVETSKTWPTTPGVVVESRVESRRDRDSGNLTYRPVVEYRYQVRGAAYRSQRLYADIEWAGSSEPAGAQRTADQYPVNAVVTVTYDPTNPGFAFLSRDSGFPIPLYLFLFAFGTPFVAVGSWLFFAALRRRSPARGGAT